LIACVDSVSQDKIFFHPKDYREIRHLLRGDGFDIPVCIDMEDRLNKLNRFSADMTFQTFLLDKENKVIVTGNLVHNLVVKELHLKRISGQSDSIARQVKTEVTVDVTDIDMGSFKPLETKQAVFTIRNARDQPLAIADVAVSCGCAAVSVDKHPAAPGETLPVI
jgi:hypothetical protein